MSLSIIDENHTLKEIILINNLLNLDVNLQKKLMTLQTSLNCEIEI